MSSRVIFCLSNQKLEKLGGHLGEIVTVSVGNGDGLKNGQIGL